MPGVLYHHCPQICLCWEMLKHELISVLSFSFAAGRIPFAFLEDIHGRFVKTYGRAALTALAYAMNDEFSRVLSQQMDYYSNDPNADRINRMRGEINQVMRPLFKLYHIRRLSYIEEHIYSEK